MYYGGDIVTQVLIDEVIKEKMYTADDGKVVALTNEESTKIARNRVWALNILKTSKHTAVLKGIRDKYAYKQNILMTQRKHLIY